MKKTLTILLVLVLALAICAPAMAEAGTITVTNATKGHKYSIYRLLDLDYSGGPDSSDGKYAYTVNSLWTGFFAQEDIKKNYIDADTNGILTWKTGADAAVFAKLALKYAEENSISATEFKTAGADGSLSFVVDTLGYYLLDSTMGSLCSLDTTNTTATVEDKNYLPTLTKEVKNGESWADANTASIGSTVEYKVVVQVGKGFESYTLVDTMEDGLTLNVNSIAVKFREEDGSEESPVDTSSYELKTTGLKNPADDFQIVFGKAFLDTCDNKDEIIITYSATLNAGAEIASETNVNAITLTTDAGDFRNDSVSTTTYQFDLVKTDSAHKLLDGAKFKLYDAATGGNEIPLVKTDNGYRPALADETPADSIVVENGKVLVYGLVGTYYLEETMAPAGYNKLTSREEVKIVDGNFEATFGEGENASTWTGGGVQVTNLTGSELPSTGGIGTTIFYVVGGLLMAVAVVLLVTKKKTSGNK